MLSSFSDHRRSGLVNGFPAGLFLRRLLVTFQDAGHTFPIFRFFGEFFSFVHNNSMTHSGGQKREARTSGLALPPPQGTAAVLLSSVNILTKLPQHPAVDFAQAQ
jgi:hypothetical protein